MLSMIKWKLMDFMMPRHGVDCVSLVSDERRSAGIGKLFIFLPFDIELHCSRCGEPCEPRGECKLELKFEVDNEVKLFVNCNKCGCCYKPPILAEIAEKSEVPAFI